MASGYVGTASDVYEMLKDEESTQNTISQIQNMFGVKEKQLEQKTAYDISSAYANYKKQQLSLMQNQKLASGFKNKLDDVMYNDYTTQYSNIGNEYALNAAELQQQKQTAIADINEAVYEQAENLNRLDELLLNYGQHTGEIMDLSQIDKPYGAIYDDQTGLTGLGFYEVGENGQRNLTDLGKEFYSKMLYGPNGGAKFVDWLNKEDEQLASFYKENRGLVNKYIAGLDEDTFDYSEDLAEQAGKIKKEKTFINTAKTEYNVNSEDKSLNQIKNEVSNFIKNKYDDTIDDLLDVLLVSEKNKNDETKNNMFDVLSIKERDKMMSDIIKDFNNLANKELKVTKSYDFKNLKYNITVTDPESNTTITIKNKNDFKKAIDQIAKLNK